MASARSMPAQFSLVRATWEDARAAREIPGQVAALFRSLRGPRTPPGLLGGPGLPWAPVGGPAFRPLHIQVPPYPAIPSASLPSPQSPSTLSQPVSPHTEEPSHDARRGGAHRPRCLDKGPE